MQQRHADSHFQLAAMTNLMKNRFKSDAGDDMRTTVTIDDELYAKALDMADADMDKASQT
jgi:hypothetical protein